MNIRMFLKTRGKFNTIRTKLIYVVSALLLGTFLLCWLCNQLFLPGFYKKEKCKQLRTVYTSIQELVEQQEKEEADTSDVQENADATNLLTGTESSDLSSIWIFRQQAIIYKMLQTLEITIAQNDVELSETTALGIEKLSADNNVNVYIIGNWECYYSQNGPRYIGNILYPVDGEEKKDNSPEEDRVLQQFGQNYNDPSDEVKKEKKIKSTVLYKTDTYKIVKVHDNRLDSDYLELLGDIQIENTKATMYMRCNYEGIQESIQLSNRFLFYEMLVSMMVGIFLMFWISDSFTKPIRELSSIAKEMSELKFETRYAGNRHDEIDRLGQSINVLSEKLEETISELKAANNALQSDIENKIQVDEMRKEFLSNVTHELKTPIALIQGYAEGLEDNINDDADSREFYCDVIIDEANKMNNMVKKLLNLNQIEFGKEQIEFERFDITAVIQSVLNSNRLLMEQKEVTLQYEQKKPVYVWADEYMMQEVFTNYISNALNHIDGERKIHVWLQKEKNVVRVSVANTGQQIPENELDKVWIKFYKVDKARTREYGGSGIGLSIVKAIMNSMHQECGVYNTPDGVTFWFEMDMQDNAVSMCSEK